MANPEHLAILKQGVEIWNQWREENGGDDLEPDFSGANLQNADLIGANFLGANLSGANLQNADLSNSNLEYAQINDTNFILAELSQCVVNAVTIKSAVNIKGIDIGVNGLYCRSSDSAALMSMTPPGNSMQGSNADAIVESLRHARKLHNISLSFAGIALLIAVLNPKIIKLPFFPDFQTEPINYAVLAILCSIGILSLNESFMRAALEGTQYINDRESAMKVGHFPWIMSKYDKGKWQSLIMRLILCFHPLSYLFLYLMFFSVPLSVLFPADEGWLFFLKNVLILIIYLGLLALSVRIFWLSQQFQKPILFDPATEWLRKTEAAILNEKVSELIELLKPKNPH